MLELINVCKTFNPGTVNAKILRFFPCAVFRKFHS